MDGAMSSEMETGERGVSRCPLLGGGFLVALLVRCGLMRDEGTGLSVPARRGCGIPTTAPPKLSGHMYYAPRSTLTLDFVTGFTGCLHRVTGWLKAEGLQW